MYCWQHHEINGRVQVAAWQLGVAAQDFNSACDRALHHHYVTSPAKLARALLGLAGGLCAERSARTTFPDLQNFRPGLVGTAQIPMSQSHVSILAFGETCGMKEPQ